MIGGCSRSFDMSQDRFDGHVAGYLTGIAASHAVADHIQAKGRIHGEAVLVVSAFASYIGFDAVERVGCHKSSPSGRETMQTRTEVLSKLPGATVALREVFLQRAVHNLLDHRRKILAKSLQLGMRIVGDREQKRR